MKYYEFLVALNKIHDYFKNMFEENMSQEFRLKNIEKIRNYFTEEIRQNELICKKHKKVRMTINYIEHFLTLASAATGCIRISVFASLFVIPIGITSSPKELKNCAITARIKKCKSIIKKKKKKHKNSIVSKK